MASSPSPAASTTSLDNSPPPLEQLVSYFVSSKRSLSSIHHVYRANDVVTSARQLLEADAVLSAKISFVRRGIDEQLTTLKAIRYGVEQVGVEGQAEFKSLLASLDESSHHLTRTLDTLRETPIHTSLQPPGTPQKYLYDFIDSSAVDDLNASLRACIDRTNDAASALTDTMDAFDFSLSNISETLTSYDPPSAPSPLPASFRILEGHATETASLLQSLVRHYDLCVTALKHTEGGNEAATRATSDDPLPTELDHPHLDNLELEIDVASLEPGEAALPPMSAAERADMLAVLANDAAEVEDVVAEIRDRVADMEGLLAETEAHVAALQTSYGSLLQAFRLLREVGKEVPGHLSACRTFQARWGDERAKIEEGVLALDGLREFYEGFLDAYDGLLVEVGRRREVRVKMERIAREAVRRIETLYEEDLAARNSFHATQGDHLPSDIWPGLVDPPPRYNIAVSSFNTEAGKDDGDDAGRGGGEAEGRDISIPELPSEVVEAAVKRMGARR